MNRKEYTVMYHATKNKKPEDLTDREAVANGRYLRHQEMMKGYATDPRIWNQNVSVVEQGVARWLVAMKELPVQRILVFPHKPICIVQGCQRKIAYIGDKKCKVHYDESLTKLKVFCKHENGCTKVALKSCGLCDKHIRECKFKGRYCCRENCQDLIHKDTIDICKKHGTEQRLFEKYGRITCDHVSGCDSKIKHSDGKCRIHHETTEEGQLTLEKQRKDRKKKNLKK